MQRIILILISCVLLASCASSKNSKYDFMSEDELYQEARQNMVARKFSKAKEAYQMLETRYPFGRR
jgi:outer membrane protein assembly factor BamD (BamD/ComL family)